MLRTDALCARISIGRLIVQVRVAGTRFFGCSLEHDMSMNGPERVEAAKGKSGHIATSLRALGVAAAIAAPAHAQTRVVYVDKAAPAGGDGSSWHRAFRDLQEALRAPSVENATVEIRMAQGVYTPDESTGDRSRIFNFNAGACLSSAVSLSLLGSFAGVQGLDPDTRDYVSTRTVLSGDLNNDDGPGNQNRSDNSYCIAMVGAKEKLIIDGIAVRGADTAGAPPGFIQGGGMLAWTRAIGTASSIEVIHCVFEDNHASSAAAGGLSASSGWVRILACDFMENSIQVDGQGGGLACWGPGVVDNCRFVSNRAPFGGGLATDTGNGVDVFQCAFLENEAEFDGGAVFGPGRFASSLFAGNKAGISGGGMASTVWCWIESCTIADNVASTGGGISSVYGWVDIRSSIVWGNQQAHGEPAIGLFSNRHHGEISRSVVEGGPDSIESTGVPFAVGEGVIGQDPRFIRAASGGSPRDNWNYRLRPGSAAISAGGDGVNLDLDGLTYVYYSGAPKPDAGCYFTTSAECKGDLKDDGLRQVDDADFTEFVKAYELSVSPPANPQVDLNRDGLVDDADFSIFAQAYDSMLCPPLY
ncbi:MAG: hypothetical protein JSR52_07090 [Planctomycetes bacterium]|nr:hypothetical protein [Planctomycetota bacterium]